MDVLQLESKINPRDLSHVYERYTGKKLEGAHGALADIEATIAVLEAQLSTGQITADASELELFTNDGLPRADLAGKLKWLDGKLCFAFGKNAGNPVTSDVGYAEWMLKSDFPEDTKKLLRKAIS